MMQRMVRPHEPGHYRQPPFYLHDKTEARDIPVLMERMAEMEDIHDSLKKGEYSIRSPQGDWQSISDWLDDAQDTLDDLIEEHGRPERWGGRFVDSVVIVLRDALGRFVTWTEIK